MHCEILVPVAKLWVEDLFSIGGYTFIPPVEDGGFTSDNHPWYELLEDVPGTFRPEAETFGQWAESVNRSRDLLHYPLIRCSVDLPQSDLLLLDMDRGARLRVLRQAAEHADAGLDLLRTAYCNYRRPEYLPNPAGELADGTTVIYLTSAHPPLRQPLIAEIARPIKTSNNWLGLEASVLNEPFYAWLAGVMDGSHSNQLIDRVRGAVRASAQSFYTTYDEARYLALIFALDGLCAPDRNWRGWKHRTYIAAVAANGSLSRFEKGLEEFEYLYSDIRNKLVHGGASFASLGVEALSWTDKLHSLLISCVQTIESNSFHSVSQLHGSMTSLLRQPDYGFAIARVISQNDTRTGRTTPANHYPVW